MKLKYYFLDKVGDIFVIIETADIARPSIV